MRRNVVFAFVLLALKLNAQNADAQHSSTQQILDRLDALEKQNQEIVSEIRSLREELKSAATPAASVSAAQTSSAEAPAPQSTIDERLTVQEHRTAEQAQTKVEAEHKFPIQLTGMLLFNAFANSAPGAGDNPGEYGLLAGPNRDGATLRQTLLGLNFEGPSLPGEGRVNGYLMMDFWGGSATPGSSWLRLRRAGISLDWHHRSFFVGQDKPLISPYQPDSLAEVGIPPLAGSGNLWYWLPQARYEERIDLSPNTTLTAQIAAIQTKETYTYDGPPVTRSIEQARPGIEGRLAFAHKFDDTRKIQIAPGFHFSTTHAAGTSIGSHIGTVDFVVIPWRYLQFSGTAFRGQNVAVLGSLGNGFVISQQGVHPIISSGGWLQVAVPITSRLTWNLFSGLENDAGYNLFYSTTVHSWTYASNVMYHLGPNLIVGLEALQLRTRTVSGARDLHNHYDLAVGYLF
ncbi:MAG TPA: hypothetical protein VKW78_09705 [Terriglobales bacterium]|jgi:hypothetical protein|nr:hypothetical protein [Terriglobales bacterium]